MFREKDKVVLISTDESIVGMGVKTLSACLIEQGFETDIVLMASPEETFRKFCWHDLYEICSGAKLIGISCMTHGVQKAIEIKNVLKSKFDIPIAIGGIHASLSPENLLDNFDIVCRGEGEDAVVDLATRLSNNESYHDIPGLWVKIGDNIVKNQSKPLKQDLNGYPFPDYDLSHQFILEAEHLVPMKPFPTHICFDRFVVLGSRGCPHSCTYCCNQGIKKEFPWLDRVRHYPAEYLINHLKEVCRIYPGVRSFWIEDDTFLAKGLEEIEEFAKRYRDEINKPFLILISPWTFGGDKVKTLIDAGMDRIIMGIQSGSENVTRNIYDRNLSNGRIMDIAYSLHKYSNMEVCYDFIGMNPFESEEDLINTIRFVKKLPPPFFIFNNSLAFYPGTELYDLALKNGIEVSNRTQHTDVNIGYRILRNEKIPYKLFHFVLLLMAGKTNSFWIGRIPRFIISEQFISFYGFLNRKLTFVTNKIISMICTFLLYVKWRKILKKLLGPRIVLKLKSIRCNLRNKRYLLEMK